jgi:PST family polysaccharide transporter/teichuronic acid exporter
MNYFNRDLDILLIGKFFGSEILGGYSLAKQLVRRPLSIIDPIVTKVTLGIFPKYQNDNHKLSLYFSKTLTLLGGINGFIYGTTILIAPYLVKLFYGNGYDNIIILVQLFTIIVFLRSMGGQVGVLTITKGRTDIDFYWNLINLIIYPLFIFIGSQYSITWVVVNIAIMQVLMITPAWFIFYKKLINMPFNIYIKPIIIPILTISIIVFFNFIILQNNLLSQIISICFIIITIIIFLYKTSTEFEFFIKQKMHKNDWIYHKNRK